MTSKASIETAFEIARVFVYGDRWRANTAWCGQCESYVPLVTARTAAALDKTTGEAIARRVETRELHHRVAADGQLFVCLCSLIDAGERVKAAEARVRRRGNKRTIKKHFVWIGPVTS